MNLRFDRQISLISSFSTRNIIAQMMTAANVDFGINRNESVKNPSDNITRTPVTIPPSVVRTPLALLTAVRVNEPVTGIDCTKAPTKLHIPSANISCVASIVLPFAVGHNDSNSLNDQNDSISISFIWRRYLQNAFATAILSRIEIIGSAMIDEPT